MNDNQFMRLRIRFDGGGCTNSARQSIRGALDSMVEDACMAINSWGTNKMVEDARTTLGNQFVGLRTQWWRMHERKSIHGAPNKMVEDARTVLCNQFVELQTQRCRMYEQKSTLGATNKI